MCIEKRKTADRNLISTLQKFKSIRWGQKMYGVIYEAPPPLQVHIYIYFFVMSVLPVCLPVCLRNQMNFQTLPRGVRYHIETKLNREKKIPLCAQGAPAVRSNVFCLLHKLHQNDFLQTWTIKISYPS